MATFKATVNQADRHKTKGDWIFHRASNRTVARSTKGKKCRFFELPAELRSQIYELVFTPDTLIELARPRQNHNVKDQAVCAVRRKEGEAPRAAVRCERPMGHYTSIKGLSTKWRMSLSGIIIANKQAYREAVPMLYERSTFYFEPFGLAESFFKTVKAENLESIQRMHFYHVTHGHGSSLEAKRNKEKADLGLVRRCKDFATSLPNVQCLELTFRLTELPNEIVPDFTNPGHRPSSVQMQQRGWIRAMREFAAMEKLKTVQVHLVQADTHDLQHCFMASMATAEAIQFNPALGTSRMRQKEVVSQRWVNYYRVLHESMSELARRMILGFPDAVVWEEHVRKLKEYQAFCWDPLSVERLS